MLNEKIFLNYKLLLKSYLNKAFRTRLRAARERTERKQITMFD